MDNNSHISKLPESNVVSLEVKKILNKPPRPALMIGNMLLFLIICTLLAWSASVKHPYRSQIEVVLVNNTANGDTAWDITAIAPANDAAKIATGEQLTIELNDFPASKYGYVKAVVAGKTSMELPAQKKVIIELKKNAAHPVLDKSAQPILKGKATISTVQRSLLERFIYRN